MSVADVSRNDRHPHSNARRHNVLLWVAVGSCLLAGVFLFVERRTGVLSGTVAKVKVVQCGESEPGRFVLRTEVVFLRSDLRSGLALIRNDESDDRWPLSTYDRTALPNAHLGDFWTCLRSGQGCDTWISEEIFKPPISIQLSNWLRVESVAMPSVEYRLKSGGNLVLLKMSPDSADLITAADEEEHWTARLWVDAVAASTRR